MLEKEYLIFLGILIFLVLSFFVWLYLSLRTIHFQKRVENFTISNELDENYSIPDKLYHQYEKLRDHISNYLKKRKVYSKQEESFQIENRKKLSTKILVSIFLLVLYLLLSLLTVLEFHFLFSILSLLLGFMIPNIIDGITRKRRLNQIEKDLLKAVSLMNHSFQSGKSIIQAVESVSFELEGPLKEEFTKMHQDMLHGLSFQTAFERFYERVNLEEVKYITTALTILNKTGGNIVEVFSSIEKSFYTKRTLEMEVKATIASSRLVFQLLVALPIFLWFIIGIWNPNYFTYFFTSTIGILLFIIIVCIYIIYVLIIRSIMKIEKF